MNRSLVFHSAAIDDGDLVIASLDGREAISSLYEYRLELGSRRDDIDFDAMLQQDAYIGIAQGVQLHGSVERGTRMLKIHGVLSEFELTDRGPDWVRYRAVLRPRFWRSALGVRSRIFLEMSTPDIVGQVLRDGGMSSSDFEINTSGTSPKRDYVVQYQESDFHFISRMLEHDGIHYRFQHRDDGCRLVMSDAASSCPSIPGDDLVPYRTVVSAESAGEDSDVGGDEEVIRSLSCRQSAITSQILLKDYDYRHPALELQVQSDQAGGAAFGSSYEFGDHYRDSDEGRTLARIRAEELRCRRKIFSGLGNSRSFRAGCTFRLRGHFRKDFDASYLITEVHHHAREALNSSELESGGGTYGNEFTAIPADAPFRPRRTTPRPVISGTINAKVDAGGDGHYAELDDQGRYRIIVNFDPDSRSPGRASAPVRMVQPYGGDGMGLHAPLHKGTEVLLTHVNGDPDRPVIAGAVPNPVTASLVSGANQSQCILKSGGGNELRFEDQSGSEDVLLHATKDHTVTVGNDEQFKIGNDQKGEIVNDRVLKIGADDKLDVAANRTIVIGTDLSQRVGGKTSFEVTTDESEKVGGSRSVEIGANHTVGIDANETINVGADQSITIGANQTVSVGAERSEDVGGSYALAVKGALEERIGGEHRVALEGSRSDDVAGDVKTVITGDRKLTVGGDLVAEISGDRKGTVVGSDKVSALSISLSALEKLVLSAGAASITLRADGTISLSGVSISISGDAEVAIKAAIIKQN